MKIKRYNSKPLHLCKNVSVLLCFSVLVLPYFLILAAPARQTAYAQESTDSADINKKIDIIKEKVASKVAQLKNTVPTGLSGTLTELEEGLFVLSSKGEEKTVNTDEETKILLRDSRLQTGPADFSDLQEGDNVDVIGEEHLATDIIDAQVIVSAPKLLTFYGKLMSVNDNNYTFKLKENDTEYLFDYETYTKTSLLEGKDFTAGGFSDLTEEARVQLIASPQEETETRYTALRLLLVIQK